MGEEVVVIERATKSDHLFIIKPCFLIPAVDNRFIFSQPPQAPNDFAGVILLTRSTENDLDQLQIGSVVHDIVEAGETHKDPLPKTLCMNDKASLTLLQHKACF